MSVSAKDFLFEAIINDWMSAVTAFLRNGGNPNLDLTEMTLTFGCITIPLLFRIECRQGQSLKPLHVVVANFFNRIHTEGVGKAGTFINLLLRAGASLESTASFTVVRLEGSSNSRPQETHKELTPLDFAFWLCEQEELKLKSEHAPTRSKVDALIAMLLSPSITSRGSLVERSIKTVVVPESVMETYKKLLVSQDQSDITFVCQDGETFAAHKAILAAASPYFATAFVGPWAENNNGEWKTEYSSSVIKTVLSFVYTGNTDGICENPMDVLSIADEWNIDPLKSVATAYCTDAITVENFASTLRFAHLHDVVNLKQACHEFASRNLGEVLTNPDVMNLPNENANL